ncbi:MAG TPA: PhzF family phenazine biosynthesis protein [Thermoleophilaceae bacterium]
MTTLPCTFVDVFTDVRFEGNGLAVVHDADGLDESLMLAFARETRLSETTFVQSATNNGADYRNRIFMMSGEVPFAGHPSLGTAVAVARARGEETARYVQQTHAGLQPIEVRKDGDAWIASMLQEPPEFGEEPPPDVVLAAVSLEPGEAHPELPAQVVATGVPQLLLPVNGLDALERIEPRYEFVNALLQPIGALTLYVFAIADDGEVRSRAFTATAEMGEDPATGSAAGPVCAYLNARLGWESVAIRQGVEMGRPSRLSARVVEDRVEVAGGVVPVIDGTLTL